MTAAAAIATTRRTRRAAPGLVLALVIVAPVLVVRVVAEPMRVSSGSMSPSFETGDQVLVEKVGSRAQDPERGDVVAFHEPGSGDLMVKRVVALSGQRVGIVDGVLVVAGDTVKEPYVDRESVDGTYFGPVRVPAGSVFVMGDARAGSVDSRAFGAVPRRAIVGRVLFKLW